MLLVRQYSQSVFRQKVHPATAEKSGLKAALTHKPNLIVPELIVSWRGVGYRFEDTP